PGEVVGAPPLEQAQEEVGDPPGRRRVLAAPRGERAGDHREEGAVDQRIAIDEIERGGGGRTGAGHLMKRNEKPRPIARAGGTPNGAGPARRERRSRRAAPSRQLSPRTPRPALRRVS